MATTVSHQVPTAQQQAIAELTGEDAATLRWQQACVQAANTLTALPNGRYVQVRMERMRQGLELAQRGAVTLPDDGEQLSAMVRSGNNIYQVDTRLLSCTCADNQKSLQTCKHILATEVTIGALGLSGLAQEPLNPPAVPVETPAPEPALNTSVPAPAPLTRIDNPAGCNLKFRIGPNELWFTLHDSSDEALLARLRTTLPLLQDLVEGCAQRYEQRTATPPPPAGTAKTTPTVPVGTPPPAPERTLQEEIAAAVQAAMKAQAAASRNGNGAPASPEAHANGPSWCAKHQVTMKWHDGNARGPGWFSHLLSDGSYCKGR
jgi:hypothetical protein